MAERQTVDNTVRQFVDDYQADTIQQLLDRLYATLGGQDPEVWARQVYLALRDDPENEVAKQLNMDRKACLTFLYKLVDAWEASPDAVQFEKAIFEIFQPSRLRRILFIGLVMDRAQSLYKMRIATSPLIGMHWYSKTHLEDGSAYALEFPNDLKELKAAVAPDVYKGFGTMNRRLYKVLYTPRFGLLNPATNGDGDQGAAQLAMWSRPVLANFVEIPTAPGAHVQAY